MFQIAALFEETANNEKEHAKIWFKLLNGGDIGTTTDNIQMLRENLVKENKENIGLLTELEITFSDKVIFSSVASGVFYFVVFIFFLAIELLVVSGKSKSK